MNNNNTVNNRNQTKPRITSPNRFQGRMWGRSRDYRIKTKQMNAYLNDKMT